ncbi:helix-turn-helix domain-containing protein [Flavobacterium branchiicola]|uniref:Helix-turn-helix domain-containing protein n=1 Tax=Flavobacterium branchiicola TaxID=1114875 RepID=A0ABV9PAT1_9FLAO|nr:AraC family transcriptional regulator [Flavobacterium branchiicola]MBS7254120.1 helix-turn-helix transcriptional regulator [Flavobacterium branchiicola]
MDTSKPTQKTSPIAYSCYFSQNREGEQFSAEHAISFQISGVLTLNDGEKEYVFNPGDFRFIKRNQLIKFLKQPEPNAAFQSVSIYLTQAALRDYSIQYNQKTNLIKNPETQTVYQLKPTALLKSLMDSLIPYINEDQMINKELQALKVNEAINILLQCKPELKDILFDFSEPGKIDLEAFMKKNFHFNVQLERFAYLTGRSLATFKRDFQRIFDNSPSRWLLQKRLQEAYYQIKEKGKTPSEVYLEVGFEDLSHFSFAFKKQFGLPPSKV